MISLVDPNVLNSSSLDAIKLELGYIIQVLVAHCQKLDIPHDKINSLISLGGKILGTQISGLENLPDKVKDMNLKE